MSVFPLGGEIYASAKSKPESRQQICEKQLSKNYNIKKNKNKDKNKKK